MNIPISHELLSSEVDNTEVVLANAMQEFEEWCLEHLTTSKGYRGTISKTLYAQHELFCEELLKAGWDSRWWKLRDGTIAGNNNDCHVEIKMVKK